MKIIKLVFVLCSLSLFASPIEYVSKKNPAIQSIETGLTILKVRNAVSKSKTYIVGSSYEGTVVGYSYAGKKMWKNKLSGFMNHDVWCADITGDGNDEILLANADGNVYCLDFEGNLLWKFGKNAAPMYAINVVHKNKEAFVVAGGFDKKIYYLSSGGALVKEIPTSVFSIEKPYSGAGKILPKPNECVANFIRTIKNADNEEILVVLGSNNHMQVAGTLYFFNPLEDKPFRKKKITGNKKTKGKVRVRPLGDFQVFDINGDGNDEIILGSSAHSNDLLVSTYHFSKDEFSFHPIKKIRFGYDIAHTVVVNEKNKIQYVTRVGSQIHIYEPNATENEIERLVSKYAYNDMRFDVGSNKIILASTQSGGSCIHVIDVGNKKWKRDFVNLEPIGKMAKIIENTAIIRKDLQKFDKAKSDNDSQPVYLMTEVVPSNLEGLKNSLVKEYHNPIFLNSIFMKNVENWDRSAVTNEKYKKSRDRRKKYTLTQEQAVQQITNKFRGEPGVSYWAGHGNDPYMFHLSTTKKVIDNAAGKKTVLIYPEMEDHSEKNLDFLVNDLIYPLADYAQGKNANIFLRSKNVFWLGSNYLESWAKLMSGEYSDVFVPSMEETTDKTMELSLAGRMGMWTSGAVDSWGTRAVPDNASFDRARQLGYQRLPSHFLRMLVFHTANGAQFINNFAVNQEFQSIYWELIAKGALYVPKRNEILSISPVHLSMKSPDHHFMNEGSNGKWTTFYDEEFETNNTYVFSRMNGSWPGASVTEYDFSRYAAGVKERRLNFLAPYENGLVLITPPQKGVFVQKDRKRKPLEDNLHPIYKNNLTEFITDGHNYYSSDGKETFTADVYFKTIEAKIKEASRILPVTVSGDVAWVTAQTAPKHIRLTLIDNGYINPEESVAHVQFNNYEVATIKDILTGEEFKVSKKGTTDIKIPLGAFRFIDIELKTKL
ncbi:hypothetical protein [Flavicella marina]|uniref:hypothetical protein n=1 Tax=Flavicella marina TaxID=1475951 RepID=UPI0012654D0E|nr:hypothetical protein [Flavicella marina]